MNRLAAFLVLALSLPGAASAEPGAVNVATDGSALAQRVAESLRAADLGPAASLNVAVKGGVVTLSGWTATLAARERAARAVEATPGVTFSYPVLTARPRHAVADSDVRSRIQEAVRAAAPAASIDVAVSSGAVRLSGTVGSAEEAAAAQDAAKGVEGGVSLVNDLRVVASTGPLAASVVPTPMVVRSNPAPGSCSPAAERVTCDGITGKVVARGAAGGKKSVLAVEDPPR